MKIKHFLYNAFIIENDKFKIAIDPGQNLGLFHLKSLIPKEEWSDISHILITHGDPDHHWQSDRVALASNAYVVCGKEMTKLVNGQIHIIDPRGKELTSWIPINNVHTLEFNQSILLDNVSIKAIKTTHGSIKIPFLFLNMTKHPDPGERTGLGATGFEISIGDKVILNLGDSIFLNEWEGLEPDVLMLPIGGLGDNTWTMDVIEALKAVEIISPKMVIPCHYNVPFLFKKKFCPADDKMFKTNVEKMGIKCSIMRYGDEITI